MKIRYLAGPRAGQEEHVQNAVGSVVVGAGLAEELASGEVTAPTSIGHETYRLPRPNEYKRQAPKWEVTEYVGVERRYVAIKMEIAKQVSFYTGHPDSIRLIGGHTPPEEIVRDYRRSWNANPLLRDHGAFIPTNAVAENEAAAREKKQADEKYHQNDIALANGNQ